MHYKLPEELRFIENGKAEQRSTNKRIDSKVCVLTGATSGVGHSAALRFAQGGANLVLICRNAFKAETTKQEILSLYPVAVDIILADFTDLSSVEKAARVILEKYRQIDILIQDAGVHLNKKTFLANGLEATFCVNHLASFLLTSLLLDRIKENPTARIVYVNSEGHRFSASHFDDLKWNHHHYSGLRGYGASKTAQLLSVWEFADILKGSGVTINAMHPGAVKSNIGSTNGPLYRWYAKHVLTHFLKDPSISAEAIYFLAVDASMARVSEKFFNLTIDEIPAKHALDRQVGKKIWDLSRKLTGLEN
jgi:NAD(P)-dependent dehydrogenase (short-subunit alcohol dehydrogenase family)